MKKKYFIIILLIAIVCIITVGYATFKSELEVTGTSSIVSNWDIEITNINVKSVAGNASKAIEPVTITNNGTVDAKVSSIETTDSLNPAIIFSTKGINQNDLLESGQTQTFDVTTAYSDKVTTQPEDLAATFAIKLNYVQN